MQHFYIHNYDGSVYYYTAKDYSDFDYQEFFEDNPEVKDVMFQHTDSDNKIIEEVFYR